jgi:hypothetical protein
MKKTGWRVEIYGHADPPDDGLRRVLFYQPTTSDSYGPKVGIDADDYLAAVKAIQAMPEVQMGGE